MYNGGSRGSGGRMGSGGRRGSRGRSPVPGNMVYRPKNEASVTVDRSLDESCGNGGRGSRGRGIVQQDVKKLSQVSNMGFVEHGVQHKINPQDDGIGSAKQPGGGAALMFSGDSKDLLQSSASCSSKNINLSGGSSVSRECEDDVGAITPNDLVNRKKDVLLSFQESLSSTSDKKVEHSRVEDHDAHKPGDAGNSLIESNTRPFDLFLKTQAFVLKPNLLLLNKEKRKATKGYTGNVIRPGMVLLKNYLSLDDQVMIVKRCRELGLGKGGFYQPGYSDEAKLRLKMMCLGKNWDPQTSRYGETRPFDGSVPPQIPVEFSQLVGKAIKESQSLVATNSKKMKGEDEIPSMSPDICIVNFYTSTGRLGLHKDKDESEKSIRKGLPVVSFSVGDSAEFLYGDQRDDDKADMILLESGDVLLFGGKSRNVFHGVRSINNNTAPKVLVQETSLRPGRLNLTFRQY